MKTFFQMTNGENFPSKDYYDSEQEYLFHQRHPNLLYNSTSKPFDLTFKDNNGDSFLAVGDFYDMSTGWWIELKSCALNKYSTKRDSSISLNLAMQHAKTDKTKALAQLNHGWNHSTEKQTIVQASLKSKGINHVVIFTDNTKLTFRSNGDINHMKKKNLFWLYENQYFSFC
ncbi:hypothetical protein ACJ5M8_003968 [Vibrio antiquarius]